MSVSKETTPVEMFNELAKLGHIQPAQDMDVWTLPGALQRVPSITAYSTPDIPAQIGEGGGQPDIDPIIRGLLAHLPRSGEVWPEAERKLWLDLLAGSFKLIYNVTRQE